jgi:hypothetical protein
LQQQILNLLDNPQLCKKSQIKVSKVTTAWKTAIAHALLKQCNESKTKLNYKTPAINFRTL